jgi:PTH1 family peptidyl-tRNA hydrolase
MNNSGEAVKKLVSYFKLKPDDVIIIHDDLDLPLGKIKIRKGGSGGGHHGVESVISSLGTEQFIRLRLGIGPTQGSGPALLSEHNQDHFNVEHFVLEPFLPNERSKFKQMLKRGSTALGLLLKEGIEIAQNQYN